MLVIVEADQESVVEALTGSTGSAEIGPTSPAGWTAAWLAPEDASLLSPLGELLSVSEDDDGETVRFVTASGVLTATWPCPTDLDYRRLVDALQQRFAPRHGREGATEDLWADDDDAVAVLDEMLALPQLDEPEPTSSVVVYRGRASVSRIVARVEGPALLRVHEAGWLSLMSPDRDDASRDHELSYALSAAISRRDALMVLCRGPGDSAGLRIIRDGDLVGTVTWNTGWVHIKDDLRDVDSLAKLLQDLVGRDVDLVALRALLRTRTQTRDPLTDLVDTIGVPPASLAALDGAPGPPEPERVERLSTWRAWWETIVVLPSPTLPRPVRMAFAILTLVWSLGCAFIATIFAAVVATDGAYVDADGTDRADWLLLTLFAGSTLLGIPLTIWRFRRALV